MESDNKPAKTKKDHSNDQFLALTADEEMAMDGLDWREQLFVVEYTRCLNTIEAAKRAGYTVEGRGSIVPDMLLTRPGIQAALRVFLGSRVMGVSEVMARLSAHARADIRHVISLVPLLDPKTNEQRKDADGNPLFESIIDPAKAIREGNSHLIKEVSQTREGLKLKLVDPQKALDKLADIQGVMRGERRYKDNKTWRNFFDDDIEDAEYTDVSEE